MERKSGILMHISSLPGDYSIGDFGKGALDFIDIIKRAGFSYWQILPICLPDECSSPYKSYSAFSINPLFIDLETLFKKGLLTADELKSAKQKTPYLAEFDRLRLERYDLLRRAAARAEDSVPEDFFDSHPHIAEFCRFMALKKSNSLAPWWEWRTAEPDLTELRFWRFCQYEAYTEWQAVKEYAEKNGVRIIGDIPIYVSHDSSDVWSEPELFELDRRHMPTSVAGVPPDYFCEDGQLWGNPLYNWERMKKDGYTWWCDRMKFMCELFDGVRIDHFRAFEAYYSIDASETTAKNGKWIKGPGLPFIEVIKKVSVGKLIIAEDLGIITDEVRALVRDSGLPGMRVLQFGIQDGPATPHLPHNYENNCIAYTGTHDNNTLLGYVWELDDSSRRRFLDYFGHDRESFDSCYDTVMRSMLASHAGIVIFPVQDLLKYGSDTRMNKPGISEKNWAFRVTQDQLSKIDTDKFSYWNGLYNR